MAIWIARSIHLFWGEDEGIELETDDARRDLDVRDAIADLHRNRSNDDAEGQ